MLRRICLEVDIVTNANDEASCCDMMERIVAVLEKIESDYPDTLTGLITDSDENDIPLEDAEEWAYEVCGCVPTAWSREAHH